jgi:hypothetical protein
MKRKHKNIIARELVLVARDLVAEDIDSRELKKDIEKHLHPAYDIVREYRKATPERTPRYIRLERIEEYLGDAIIELRRLK